MHKKVYSQKARTVTRHLIFAAFIALGFGPNLIAADLNKKQHSRSPEQVPNGLSASDWTAIRELTADAVSQQAYAKASNTNAHDFFGYSVAVSGDTVVVGAPLESSNATGVNGDQTNNSVDASGAVYVFVRNGTTWTQQAYLKASNTGVGDQFGFAVAISGDTLVVGAPFEDSIATGINGDQNDNSVNKAGAAYVFVRSGTTWTQQAYLKASNTDDSDEFGTAMAISGDTVVVGAAAESSSATGVNGNQADNSEQGAGAAYVFVRNGTTWTQQAYLKASNTAEGADFGFSVAISGDTVVVGAVGEASKATGINGDQTDESVPEAGAAYVFVRNGTTWSQQAYLKASNTDEGDEFGYAVAISGDTVVVGAVFETSKATGINGNQADNSAPDAGAAYVFVRNGATWSQQAYLKASNTDAMDQFGSSVAIFGGTIVVGAPFESSNATGLNGNQNDNSAVDAGAAYVFTRSGTTWKQSAYVKASNTGASDFFGYAVAISGDEAVVGAYLESSNATGINGNQSDNSAPSAGAAYIFTGFVPAVAQNLSTRMQVLTGDNIGIGGFIITGSSSKHVVVRAIGPSLSQFGIANPLADPILKIVGPAGFQPITNDNWRDSQQGILLADGLAPSNDSEAAIDVVLPPGAYTAQVNGKNGGTGIGVIEVYDLDAGSVSKLADISTRAVTGTNTSVLIAGFILGKNAGATHVVVRGIGPSLSSFGVPSVLANPFLELRDANGALVRANDNWQDDSAQAAEISAAGLAPSDDKESAISATLPPNRYTAIVSGVNNTTGNAVVEVYDLGAP
jgi:hypothetical protein